MGLPGRGQGRHPTPRPHARGAETLLVRTVLQTVLTDRNVSKLLAESNDFPLDSGVCKHQPVSRGTKDLVEDLKNLLLPLDRARESRELLGRFIAEIRVHAEKAVVHYLIPLPADSPMEGMCRQDIKLPGDVVA